MKSYCCVATEHTPDEIDKSYFTNYRWITLDADSLDESIDLAYKLPNVDIVLEASWIPGGVVT